MADDFEHKQSKNLLLSFFAIALLVPSLSALLIYGYVRWYDISLSLSATKSIAFCIWLCTVLAICKEALLPVFRERRLRKKLGKEYSVSSSEKVVPLPLPEPEEESSIDLLFELFSLAFMVPLLTSVFLWLYCHYYEITLSNTEIKRLVMICWLLTLIFLYVHVILKVRRRRVALRKEHHG